jgi:hypothetical protein
LRRGLGFGRGGGGGRCRGGCGGLELLILFEGDDGVLKMVELGRSWWWLDDASSRF